MEYYKLIFDYEKDEKYLLAEPSIDVKDQYMFCNGEIIESWESIQFECDLQNGYIPTENLGNSYGWEIFSEKALKMFGNIIK